MSFYKNERGSINPLLIPLILSVLCFFGALGFGMWAYTQMSDYKNNSDQKVEAAVKVAVDKNSSKKDNEFLEREKDPLRDYQGAAVFGNITFKYPKTWSGYTDESSNQVSLMMAPGIVHSNQKSYALRINVKSQTYDAVVKSYESRVKEGKARASAYRLASLPDVLGSRIDGEIGEGVNGSVVILPLRDKTIIAATESKDFVGDFDKIILASFKFNP